MRKKFLQRVGDQFVTINIGLGKNLGVFNIIVAQDLEGTLRPKAQLHSLQGAAPDVNAPDGLCCGH